MQLKALLSPKLMIPIDSPGLEARAFFALFQAFEPLEW
jgi:hypothetical protein